MGARRAVSRREGEGHRGGRRPSWSNIHIGYELCYTHAYYYAEFPRTDDWSIGQDSII